MHTSTYIHPSQCVPVCPARTRVPLWNLTISSVRGKGGCRRVAKPFSRDDDDDERFSSPSVRPTDRPTESRVEHAFSLRDQWPRDRKFEMTIYEP